MELERLTKRIIDDAEKERERIKRENEERISALVLEIEKERERLRKEEKEKIKKEIERVKRKQVADKRLKEKNRLLTEQWRIVREVLAEVKKEFRVRVGDYFELLRGIIERFAKDGDTVVFAPDDFSKFQSEFPELKKENSNHLSAGVIIKKEREEIDFSLESELQTLKEETLLDFKEYLRTE